MKKFIAWIMALLTIASGLAAAETPAAKGRQARETFARTVQEIKQEDNKFAGVQVEGRDGRRLVVQAKSEMPPRAPRAVEMDAKRLGFDEIVYRGSHGDIKVNLALR